MCNIIEEIENSKKKLYPSKVFGKVIKKRVGKILFQRFLLKFGRKTLRN